MRRLAAGLRACGVGFCTKVLAGLENTGEAVLLHIAVRELGAILVPLLPGLTFGELAFQIQDSAGELLVCDGRVAEALLPRLDDLPPVRVASLAELSDHEPLESEPIRGFHPLAPSAIMYTSGSTSRPKGVVLPAGAFYSTGHRYAQRFPVDGDDTYLLPLTIAHGVGGTVAQAMVMHAGAQLALEDRFSPSEFWSQVRRNAATCTLLFPAQMNLLLMLADERESVSPATLRLVITQTWSQEFVDRFGTELALVWASTECGSVGAGSDPGYRGGRGNTYVGRPFDEIELAIFEPGDGGVVKPGSTGEIRLRQPYAMLEYFGEPELTRAALDAGGWIHTGDLGRMDSDGHLHFLGRSKNMVKRSGENISPAEIEEVLVRHPAVVECLVFGVADPVRTEELAAVVVLDGDSPPEQSQLVEFASRSLARWKLPRYVSVSATLLPRLGNGKLDRRRVVDDFDLTTCWDGQSRR
jgi:acyl-CoA synthetase (AMP-forming)/AMP-acid ligase II